MFSKAKKKKNRILQKQTFMGILWEKRTLEIKRLAKSLKVKFNKNIKTNLNLKKKQNKNYFWFFSTAYYGS